jgi:DNA-3-methyladenine glycosylase I
MPDVIRCGWAGDEPFMRAYHDEVWGVPLHGDRALFEFITLEGAQAGLSWRTILLRLDSYRAAFDGWDIERIAAYSDADVERLLANTGIIRNRAKVLSTIDNARATLDLQRELGSLDAYLWQFVGGSPIRNSFSAISDVPSETAEARAMSAALKKRGFRFVGPTICYALMQATGMVNDHLTDCFRYGQV